MDWLWIVNLMAALSVLWGLRRWLRNRRRLLAGAVERYPNAARIAMWGGLCWIPIYIVMVMEVRPWLQDADRRHALMELRAFGARIDEGWLIDLSGTKVTDEQLRLLPMIPEIEEVNLSGTGVTDAAVDYLVELPWLRAVSLQDTAISDEGRERLQTHMVGVSRAIARRHAQLAAAAAKAREEEKQLLWEVDRGIYPKQVVPKADGERYQDRIKEEREKRREW